MEKTLITPEQIVTELNTAMAESEELDGDCKECQVRRVGRVTGVEAKYLGRNWNVDMVNGERKRNRGQVYTFHTIYWG